MPHPFFDSSSYPWHRQDARTFHVELYSAIADDGVIQTTYKGCGPGLIPLAKDGPYQMWQEALDALAPALLLRELGKRLEALPYPKVKACLLYTSPSPRDS